MNNAHIFFNKNEAAVMGMALGALIEDLNAIKQGEYANVPFTPESRKYQREIIEVARSAAAKLERFAGIKCDLPPYNEGDENEFLTKES